MPQEYHMYIPCLLHPWTRWRGMRQGEANGDGWAGELANENMRSCRCRCNDLLTCAPASDLPVDEGDRDDAASELYGEGLRNH
uniref:Uncharacterized protein n=2 Tax=Oryza TaxID=4527 RepID=A0A0E0D494_9ORYZ